MEKIKICHVTSVHKAKDARIFYKECVSLAKTYEVFLIAPNVDDEFIYGVHIVGVSIPHSRLRRLLSLKNIYEKAIQVNAAVYHFHDPELMGIGLKLKKRGKKIIFDSHEDVPAQILGKQYIPRYLRNPLSYLYSYYEKFVLSKFDVLVTVTPHIVERLRRINKDTVMITNYPVVKEEREEKTELPFDDRKYVCFVGAVSPHYRHDFIINLLDNSDTKYLLAGPAETSYFETLKSLKGWDKVDYRGVIPADDVYKLLNQSYAGLVIPEYRPNAGYKRGTIGVLKMFEYMLAGIPVIATDFDLWKDIIERNECGICVNPYSAQEISDAINYYRQNPDVAMKHGKNGKRAVYEHYCWATQELKLIDIYKRLLS